MNPSISNVMLDLVPVINKYQSGFLSYTALEETLIFTYLSILFYWRQVKQINCF